VCNPAAVQAAEELHARGKGYFTSVAMSLSSTIFPTYVSLHGGTQSAAPGLGETAPRT